MIYGKGAAGEARRRAGLAERSGASPSPSPCWSAAQTASGYEPAPSGWVLAFARGRTEGERGLGKTQSRVFPKSRFWAGAGWGLRSGAEQAPATKPQPTTSKRGL